MLLHVLEFVKEHRKSNKMKRRNGAINSSSTVIKDSMKNDASPPTSSSTSLFFEVIKVIRPLSLTCSVVATLVTTAVVQPNVGENLFLTYRFYIALLMAICVQCGANLTNTYYDFINGVDVVDQRQLEYRLDRGLAIGRVPQSLVLGLMCFFYAVSICCTVPIILQTESHELIGIFSIGMLLAFFYTANPSGFGGLKYKAMGDIVIFACFGPLLMQCVSLMLIEKLTPTLYIYSIPIGLLTEAILHANNSRDEKTDMEAGAVTLAGLLGWQRSFYLYIALFVGAYLAAIYIAFNNKWGCVLTLLTIPIAQKLVKYFSQKEMDCLPQQTSKLHLPFGLLFFVGILISDRGILSLLGN